MFVVEVGRPSYKLTENPQTLNFNPASWRLPYDHVVWKDPKQILASSCLQFLLILLLYPVPEEGQSPPPKNYFRHFLGRLHRPQDFQFIAEGMKRILNQPVWCMLTTVKYYLILPIASSHFFLFARKSEVDTMGARDDHAILGDNPMQ